MPRRELKQRVSESRAKRFFALPNRWSSESHQACLNGQVVTEVGVANVSCFNRARALLAWLNNHNTAKKNGYFLGHSDNLITLSLSLSLSLSLRYSPTIAYTLSRYAGARVKIRLFLQTGKGSRCVFLSLSARGILNHLKTIKLFSTMKTATKQKRHYERPHMRVVEMQHMMQLLAGSGTGSQGNPNYNPFNDEEDW